MTVKMHFPPATHFKRKLSLIKLKFRVCLLRIWKLRRCYMFGKSKCIMPICPLSFGLALGITSALAVFLWSVWAMYNGLTPMMIAYHMPMPTWQTTVIHSLWCFLKGFIFGFVLILIYDFFACCVKGKMCKCGSVPCKCGNGCSKCGSSPCQCK